MDVYRIVLVKWADKLTGSGRAARWNSMNHFVVYTASSRALACLENVVHRSGRGLQTEFRTMVINIPDSLPITDIRIETLGEDWTAFENYGICQQHGDAWLAMDQTAVLRVPSAIIPLEFNYLLNPQHPDFRSISIKRTEPFTFDSRIKAE